MSLIRSRRLKVTLIDLYHSSLLNKQTLNLFYCGRGRLSVPIQDPCTRQNFGTDCEKALVFLISPVLKTTTMSHDIKGGRTRPSLFRPPKTTRQHDTPRRVGVTIPRSNVQPLFVVVNTRLAKLVIVVSSGFCFRRDD